MIKNLTKQDMKIYHLSEARHNVSSEKEKQHSNSPRPAEDFALLSTFTWWGNRIKGKTDSSFLPPFHPASVMDWSTHSQGTFESRSHCGL